MRSSEVRQRLGEALRQALRARDKVAVSALRTTLAAIDNAGAVPAAPTPAASGGSPHFAGATAGLGAAEAEPRSLTEADLVRIVRTEIAAREAAAQQYDRAKHPDQAGRLRREASILRSVIGDDTAG